MKIGLLGHGVVGSGVTAITDSCARKKVRRLEVTRILVKDESELTDPRCTLNVEEILQDPEIELVAECMGGLEPAHTMVSRALEAGKHVVVISCEPVNRVAAVACTHSTHAVAVDVGLLFHVGGCTHVVLHVLASVVTTDLSVPLGAKSWQAAAVRSDDNISLACHEAEVPAIREELAHW